MRQHGDRGVGGKTGCGQYREVGLVVGECLRTGKQVQNDWSHISQSARLIRRSGWNKCRGPLLHLHPHIRIQFCRMFQTGRCQQMETPAVLLRCVTSFYETGQQPGSLHDSSVGDGHPDDVFPLIEMRVRDEEVEVKAFHSSLGT
ncbi:hypothetical protein XF35_24300 [Streptomyces platensis subsp. clarensis]|nr:hypothetical protein [Streptomyces platensis subsp. clarensis]